MDRGLKAARENTGAAESLLEAARSSSLPSVSLEAGYIALDKTPAFRADLLGQSLQLPMAQQDSAAYKAMATLPLYTGAASSAASMRRRRAWRRRGWARRPTCRTSSCAWPMPTSTGCAPAGC
ncbi:TolC family protein [Thiobacillus sp.]|uniref:TolC family protein n=1 Tax=Thiobacillus sp. TaxID=924 RepID=UPI0025F67808|nr:TolC family protein [Thiobacillus sp.]